MAMDDPAAATAALAVLRSTAIDDTERAALAGELDRAAELGLEAG
jgi:hypothetical protein